MSWADDDPDGAARFEVVLNHEEQYSIWPQGWDLPQGWRAAGHSGSKADCLAYIEEVWTDMRPLSLRRDEAAARAPAPGAATAPARGSAG
jgi:MbtH protein